MSWLLTAVSVSIMSDDPRIDQLVRKKQEEGKPFFSFEYYPPRTDDGVENLIQRFAKMKAQGPLFCDMTWGAGGSTSDLTLDLCKKMKELGLVSNMHLTCTNMEVSKIDAALEGAKKAGIRNIVALRGDPPHGQDKWEATEGGFQCALDLVKYIREKYGDYFCLSVAGYPEGHPNSITPVDDESKLSESEKTRVVKNSDGVFVCTDEAYAKEIAYLKEKIDAGANMIITQMFFDTPVFLKFVNDCREVGIDVPILPGIMLIQNAGGFKRMTAMCKSRVPDEVREKVDACGDDKDAIKEYGSTFGHEVCQQLIDAKLYGLHLYCLNLEQVVYRVLDKLGLKQPVAE